VLLQEQRQRLLACFNPINGGTTPREARRGAQKADSALTFVSEVAGVAAFRGNPERVAANVAVYRVIARRGTAIAGCACASVENFRYLLRTS